MQGHIVLSSLSKKPDFFREENGRMMPSVWKVYGTVTRLLSRERFCTTLAEHLLEVAGNPKRSGMLESDDVGGVRQEVTQEEQ